MTTRKKIRWHLFAGLLLLALSLHAETNPGRKKVGVVLSGGGAKGMAHIGALKVIEEAGIPIDCIVGTSMGSIIGGLYAIGYSPAQLDSMVRCQDWSFLLSDRTPRSEQNMAEREADEKFIISQPFGKGVKTQISGGLIKGQNLANLFSKLTLGYHDSIDFNRLPIPFACVSMNIVNGTETDFHHGVLATAMRASMAIPGVFSPVRLDDKVLVDGGVINNYPVNIARQMGADIVIGIDVQSELKPSGELNTTGSILGQLVNLMGQDLYKENLKATDTYIKVNVEGYSAASFSSSAIDVLIGRGEEAARGQAESLGRLKHTLGLPSAYRPEARSGYAYQPEDLVQVQKITFDGLDKNDKKWLLNRCDLKEHSEISIAHIEEVTTIIRANTGYSEATYTLTTAPEGGYNLNYAFSKKYENRLNVGIRFDSKEIASLLINATCNIRTRIPSSLSVTGRLGKRCAAHVNYAFEPFPLSAIGLTYTFQYNDIDYLQGKGQEFNAAFRYHLGEFSYTNVWLRNVQFGLGIRYEYYDYDKFLYQDKGLAFNVGSEHFYTYFGKIAYDTYDKAYFPSHGVNLHGAYELYTDNFAKYKEHTPFSAVSGMLEAVVPLTHRFSVLPSVSGRFLIGNNVPFAKMNMMGGSVRARFLPDQLPFTGINQAAVTDNSLLIGGLKLRQRMGSIHYLTLSGSYALSSHKLQDLFQSDKYFGCGIGYGMDSMFGPLEVSLNYTDYTDKVNLYINLGYKF